MNATRTPGLAARLLAAALAAASLATISGCAAVAAAGIAGGAMMMTDRRSVGAQADDQTIEVKALAAVKQQVPTASVSVTSYNRRVLLTGRAPDEAARRRAEAAVTGLEGVRSVYNEVTIGPATSFGTDTEDATITTKVKAALLDVGLSQANVVKVVTDSGTVYLMGIVTRAEGDAVAKAASRVSGVKRVLTFFEYVTPEELKRIESLSTQTQTPAPAGTPTGLAPSTTPPAAPAPAAPAAPATGAPAQVTPVR